MSSLALGTARDPGAATAALGTLCQGLPTLPGNNSFPISHPSLPSGTGKPFPVSCPSSPWPQSLSSSPGAPSGPKRAERGYDPYNPELPRASLEAEDGALGDITDVTPGILELELVNKAIEAVKNEVEREQKKYEELLETTKELGASEGSSLISNSPVSAAGPPSDSSFGSLEYNPGSYNFNNNSDYNPTPLAAAGRSSKYTLDLSRSKGSSLEYVPKAVVQNKKYNSTVTNNKYVIDDSKPSTDLEYDPLSNYSARLLGKATTKGSKRERVSDYEDSYSPSRKKLCEDPEDDEVLARFSSSEDEAEVEYKTASGSSPSKAGSESESNNELSSKEQSTKVDGSASQEKGDSMCWNNLILVMTECLQLDLSVLKAAVKCKGSVLFCVESLQRSGLSATPGSIWPEDCGDVDGWRKGCRE
uniref:Uncharacterized protein n=1 Tax=Malurus cyaneus samueli TaxID=2593467 RepID=A0A8C5TZ70_9PASS